MNTLTFTGRRSELDQIKERWRLAADVKNPKPQIVLIKGEPGVGKTRLAFEFYRWLSENVDQAGPEGYWPDALALYENAVNTNPEPSACKFNVKIPYLWWGLYASRDTILSSYRYLRPHLCILLARSIMRRKGLDLAGALARLGLDVGMGLIQDLTGLSLLKRIGEGVQEGMDILGGGSKEALIDEALEISHIQANSIIDDLELVFDQKRDYAGTPGVILFDDAQNAEEDAALLPFMETVLYKSITQKWPLLILVTHWKWKRELSSEITLNENSFAGILRHCLNAGDSKIGPAAGLPGGYLDAGNFHEIDLHPVEDLSAALRDELPGLTETQSTGILGTTGGNPLYLEQVIQFARERPKFFDENSPLKALTEDGFREILKETKNQPIFSIVRKRLIYAPIEVQEAICLASLQGMRFAIELVEAIAHHQIGQGVGQWLEKAEDPYSWVVGTKSRSADGVGAFVERLFHQVAEDVRPDLKSLETEAKLQGAFRETVKGLVLDPAFAGSVRPDAQLIVYGIAADLFEKCSTPDEREIARTALGLLAKVEFSRFSLEATTTAYERLLEIEPPEITLEDWYSRIKTLSFLTSAYRKLGWPAKQSRTLKRMIALSGELIQDSWGPLAFAGDEASVHEYFEGWQRQHPDIHPQIYGIAVSWLVRALLGLSELARVWQDTRPADGDDPMQFAPFMLKTVEVTDKGDLNSSSAFDLDPKDVGYFLRERAVNLGKIVGPDFTEREHFKLLVDDISKMYTNDLILDAAIDALQRALTIAEEFDDQSDKISVLNDLGVVYGKKGDSDQSVKVLLEAGHLFNELNDGGSFSVADLSDGSKIEYRRLESVSQADGPRILRQLEIPIRLADAFDLNPEDAVGQFWQLVRMAGNIYANLGCNSLDTGDLDKANERFERAIEKFIDLNDGPSIATTFNNLATVARRRGDLEAACGYWHRSISVYRKLKEVDTGKINEVRWNNAIQDLKSVMEAAGCRKKISSENE